MTRPALLRFLLLCLLLPAAACDAGARDGEAATREAVAAPTAVVDSAVPLEVALRRFREGLPAPRGLRAAFRSREALVEAAVAALAAADTGAFEAMAVDRAEYAWLYYPTSPISRPPYELPPALAWFRLQAGNRTAVLRSLRELGGEPLVLRAVQCDPEPALEGENRIWTGCRVTLGRPGAELGPFPLFGALLEREGRFEVLSFANDF